MSARRSLQGGIALAPLVSLLMAGCFGGGSDGPSLDSKTPLLSEGAYAVAASGDSVQGSGDAFFNADRRGYVVLADVAAPSAGDSTVLYVSGADGARRVPAAVGGLTLTFDRSTPLGDSTLDTSTLPGSYDSWLAGKPVSFAVDAAGVISSTASCALSGRLDAATRFGAAIAATLKVGDGCGIAAGTYQGLAYTSTEIRPARWRLVAENGLAVVDLFAYR